MTEQIRDLIDAIVDENSVDAEKVFSSVMYDKISEKIDTFRKEVANSYFNEGKAPGSLGGTDVTEPAVSPDDDGEEEAPAEEEAPE